MIYSNSNSIVNNIINRENNFWRNDKYKEQKMNKPKIELNKTTFLVVKTDKWLASTVGIHFTQDLRNQISFLYSSEIIS